MDQTLADLAEDFAELSFLARSGNERLSAYAAALTKNQRNYGESEYEFLSSEAVALQENYANLSKKIESEKSAAAAWSINDAPGLIEKKKSYYRLLRAMQHSLGATLSAGNWQSPSFAYALSSEAGNETGGIEATENDYKRDGHDDGIRYARSFIKECVDSGIRSAPEGFVTGSGMAAAVAILKTLGGRGPILAGRNTYFQTKRLFENNYDVAYVDEFDTESILSAVTQRKPRMAWFDTLANSETVAAPNLSKLVPALAKSLPRGSALVLDNTCLATGYQPFRDWPLLGAHADLVVFESLLKYHQFGFDRVNAGIVWATGGITERITKAKADLGIMLSDQGTLTLPVPNRKQFDARLRRIGRNALFLASYLERFSKTHPSMLSGVSYPGLPSHPGFEWTKQRAFNGGFLVLQFKPDYRSLRHYDAFVGHAIVEARKKNLDLIGGSSFGFDTTRVYLTARTAQGAAAPFVRISAGTETMAELEALSGVLGSAAAV